MPTLDSSEELAKNLERLYGIEGEVFEGEVEMISVLRQLINEEFVHNKRQITSQNIYNLLHPYLVSYSKKKELKRHIELLDMAYDTIISYGYMRDDGKYYGGGFSTQELAFSYMREIGAVDRKGLFDPQKYMKYEEKISKELNNG